MKKKAVCLISDGLDSPVATFLIEQKGIEVIGINFDNRPMVKYAKIKRDQNQLQENIAIGQIQNIAQALVNSFMEQTKFKLFIVPNGEDLEKITTHSYDPKITCVLCKRLMVKKAEIIANEVNAEYIATGEILGEQASQTIDNLKIIEDAVNSKRLIRPNIGLNKEEVITIAREIGTYQFAELAAKYTCSAVPNKPVTKTNLDRVLAAEEKLGLQDAINSCFTNAKQLDFQKS
ncbi:MAG: 7-cyano-7-deazaguanine synthase [Candidatus Heimdallarchaeota archaeon]